MKKRILCMSFIGLLATAMSFTLAYAGFGGAQGMRMTRNAISRNLDFTFRPKLNFEKVLVGPVSSLALSADEQYLLAVVGGHKLRLWDLYAGREIAVSDASQSPIVNVAIAPDSRLAFYACADGTVHSWDIKTLQQTTYKELPDAKLIAFHQDGRVVLGGSKGELSQWNPKAKTQAITHIFGDESFQAMAINDNDRVLLASDETIYVVDDIHGTLLQTIDADDTVTAMKTKGNLLFWATEDGDVARWNMASNKLEALYDDIDESITSLDVQENATILCGTEDGKLYSIDSHGDTEELGSHDEKVTFVCMNATAENALTASEDGTCKLWNLQAKSVMLTMISAVDGWAVVDNKGRFDGTQAALEGIEWQDGKESLNIRNFSEVYYEPNLLPRLISGKAADLEDVPAIGDGIHLAANVEISGNARGEQKAIVRVVGSAQKGSGIRGVKLYQNGKRVADAVAKTSTQTGEGGEKELIREFTVTLGTGKNIFSAVAVNDEQLESAPAELVINSNAPEAAQNLWFVTVGVNKYALADLNLDYAKPDAESLYSYFDKNTNLMVHKKKLLALYDTDANSQNIDKIFSSLQFIPRDDLVVIYMAGHGIIVGDEWYFLPSNIHEATEEQIVTNGISTKALKKYIESVGADRVALFLDACQSGGALSPIQNFKGIKSLRLLAREVGVHILAATDREQFAVELASLGHGVFTYSLLHALENPQSVSGKTQQTVSIREVMANVEREVPMLSKRFANYAQFPVSYSRGSDFSIIYK